MTPAQGDAYETERLGHLRPADWVNPAPKDRYDLVVIGGGAGGLMAAAVASQLGASVALVERGLLGGDCLNVGCVPSKSLIRAARAAADVRDTGRFGVYGAGGAQADFAAAMEYARSVRARLAEHDSAARFRDIGVDVFLAEARFTAPNAVEADGATLRFKRAIIATGSRPKAPDIPGLEEAGYLTNETVFDLTERPVRLAVVGSGPIGCELGQAFQRLGSQVTILEQGDQILPRDDADVSKALRRRLKEEGLDILLESQVERVETAEGARRLHVRTPNGAHPLDAEALLVAVGRTPNVDALRCEAAGVETFEHGVRVDDRLRTSNRRVYAVGEVALREKYTHAAEASATLAVRNALLFGRKKWSDQVVPWCTYTDPEVAHAGARESEDVDTYRLDLSCVDRAVCEGEADGFVKLHVKRGSGRIAGASVVARHAGEIIAPIVTAMKAGMPLSELSQLILPYPTQAQAAKRAAGLYMRSKLTPLTRKVLRMALSVAR